MSDRKFLSADPAGVTQNSELETQKKAQRNLYAGLLPDAFDLDGWIAEFHTFAEKYDRFLYSEISSSIISDISDEQVLCLLSNLTAVTERTIVGRSTHQAEKNSKSRSKNERIMISSKEHELLYKLYDHCNLANVQRIAYKETEDSIQRNVTESFERKYSEEYDRNIKPKMDSLEKDITTQLIALVSIFTALAFVMFGSISVLDSLLKNIETSPVIKTMLVGNLWLICMTTILVLFAKFICFMVGRGNDFNWIKVLLILDGILIVILGLILFFGRKLYGTVFFL